MKTDPYLLEIGCFLVQRGGFSYECNFFTTCLKARAQASINIWRLISKERSVGSEEDFTYWKDLKIAVLTGIQAYGQAPLVIADKARRVPGS